MTAATKGRRATQNNIADPLAQFAGLGVMATSMAAASQAYMDAVGKCQGEICNFMTKRLSDDLNHSQQLAKCEDWRQAAVVQQEWVRQVVEDYVSEGQKLFQLGARAANTSTSKE